MWDSQRTAEYRAHSSVWLRGATPLHPTLQLVLLPLLPALPLVLLPVLPALPLLRPPFLLLPVTNFTLN